VLGCQGVLLIDLVAQTGHYKAKATNLQTDFVVGRRKTLLASPRLRRDFGVAGIAIDRFDGTIVGRQFEEVTE
jgi:hypothetical protein